MEVKKYMELFNECTLESNNLEEFATLFKEKYEATKCGDERPIRKTLCQLEKNHEGSCQATVYWEKEEN